MDVQLLGTDQLVVQSTEATKAYQAIIEEDNTHVDALNNYAVLLMQQKYLKHATDIFERILLQRPDSFYVWNNLGLAYKGCGRVQDAQEAFSMV